MCLIWGAIKDTAFYAYDNGAVIPELQENYIRLLKSEIPKNFDSAIPQEHQIFLKKYMLHFPMHHLMK